MYAKQQDLLDKLSQVEAFLEEKRESQVTVKKCILNLQAELKAHHAILKKGILDGQGVLTKGAAKKQETKNEGQSSLSHQVLS